jgi:probable F420-dependent oxidoreductase
MRVGVNVPNFGPGTNPDSLARWAEVVEGLGFDLLMVSDHLAVTSDVAEQYPAPFYEPFTTLAWLAGITTRITLGTTVLIVPYRHPLLIARMAANLHQLSGGRLILGVGTGWARQEFEALGVPFQRRGELTDDHIRAVRAAWDNDADYRCGQIPIWVGGNSDVALRRAVRLGAAWHPLRFTMPWFRDAVDRLRAIAAELQLPVPDLAPRIVLRLAEKPIDHPERRAGEGTIGQILDDIEQLSLLGAGTVLLDPYNGDPNETLRPEAAWQALATVAAHRAWPTPYRDGIAVTLDNHDLPGSDVDRAAAFSEADLQHLRRCVELATEAVDAGDCPFGSVLVDADGKVLAEERNRESTTGDATRHPEFELARWAATNLSPEERATATVYTSGEHCPMCAAAHGWVGLGRIVYVSSSEQAQGWLAEMGVTASPPVRPLSIRDVVPHLEVAGPVPELAGQVRALHRRFRTGTSAAN